LQTFCAANANLALPLCQQREERNGFGRGDTTSFGHVTRFYRPQMVPFHGMVSTTAKEHHWTRLLLQRDH